MSRPQLYGSPAHRRGVVLREEAIAALEAAATKQGRPMSRLMADAIEKYLAERVDWFEPILRPDCPDDGQAALEVHEPDTDLEACA